jgi:2-polyprenyl-3-methyl-5-hydroxy-6-metoxy-1,4-benzoquinol methylase
MKPPRWTPHSSDQAWRKYGQLDPYFGVVSRDRFRSGSLDQRALHDFFESGAEHVSRVTAVIRQHVRPDFHPARALDFGCGVGRVTIPLASICDSVVGVDVSEAMLEEARRNCDARGIVNVELLAADDRLSAVSGSFDFIHSFIVLQHVSPRRGNRIVQALLERLSENGIAVLQLTYYRRASRARRALHWMRRHIPLMNHLTNVIQGRQPGYPLMEMHNYGLNQIFLTLQAHACHQCHIRFTDHGGHLGVVLFLVKGALPSM